MLLYYTNDHILTFSFDDQSIQMRLCHSKIVLVQANHNQLYSIYSMDTLRVQYLYIVIEYRKLCMLRTAILNVL